MRVLGLDIASTTGVGVIEDGKLIFYSKFTLPDTQDNVIRYKAFRKFVLQLYKEYRPNVVAIEAVFVGPNPKISAYLSGLRAIAMEALPKKTVLRSSTVAHIRGSVIGSGKKYDKLDVLTFVNETYSLTLNFKKDLDISDAICLAHWAYTVDATS